MYVLKLMQTYKTRLVNILKQSRIIVMFCHPLHFLNPSVSYDTFTMGFQLQVDKFSQDFYEFSLLCKQNSKFISEYNRTFPQKLSFAGLQKEVTCWQLQWKHEFLNREESACKNCHFLEFKITRSIVTSTYVSHFHLECIKI